MDEIEKLWVSLGITPDEPSASEAVGKMLKAVQTKLNSSVYGGKKGVITLPATIEGTYKNGKEIEQEIKDAYAAIYQKAKQMADESVSLTLDDLKDFKNQINKFAKLTSKKNANDVIANANNNLRQALSDYQDFVNDLRKQVSVKQKQELKVSPPKKPAKKKSTNYISDEEIDAAITKENERQAKIKARRDKEVSQLSSKLDYRSGGIDLGKTNKKEAMASEFSEYSSQWARELAKTLRDTYSTELTNHFFDKNYKSDQPKGRLSRPTTKEEVLNHLSTEAIKELGGLIDKVEAGSTDVTFGNIVDAIGVIRTIFEENGKDMTTIAQAISTTVQGRYDQPQSNQPDDHSGSGIRRKTYPKKSYGNRVGGIDAEEGFERGVGKGHAQTQVYQAAIQRLLKKMLGEVEDLSRQEEQATQAAIKMTNQYERYKESAKNSNASKDTKRMADELKGESSRDTRSYIQDVRESNREASADTAEGQKNIEILETEKQNTNTGLNTDANTKKLIDAVKLPKAKPIEKDKTETKKDTEVEEETEENAEPIKAEIPVEQQEISSDLTPPVIQVEGSSAVETILTNMQKTLGSINKHTNAISKKISGKSKKNTDKKKTTSGGKPPKTPQNEQQSEEIGNLLPDVIRKVALETVDGKPQLVTKVEGPVDKPITPHNEFDRPYSIKPSELVSINASKTPSFADKRNEDKLDTDRPKTMYGAESNPLSPMVIEEFKNAIPKMELTGNKQVYEKPSDIELPGWAKAEKAVEDQTKALEDEEKARKKLADQVVLETKLAKQRNNNKLQPRTPAVIKLGDEQESDTSKSLQDMLKKAFAPFSKQSAATQAMQMSASERAAERARRMKLYGKPRGRGDASDLGVVSDIRYSKNLWRGNDKSRGADDPLFRNIRKTDSISGIDPDKVLDGLQKAIQDGMFKAQTGGLGANLLGAVSGGLSYFAQPSLEKSRAQAEGLNQVMANVRNEVLEILETIRGKEDTLGAMQQSGDAVFDDEGRMTYGTPEAIAEFNELENAKDILDSLLAETANVDAVVKECGGDIGKIVQQLSFVAPELRKENVIIQNIGKGLDKNGKALKFQNRGAEVLNYSFQLISRYIGQMVKNWMMMLNPLSLVKKAFQDFTSYDVKWQRTMNVIKYNLRRIVKPMMEWIAQQIVNMIGLVNALMKGIGKVFNQNWDLFDQSAASAEQMREELEQAANVTAGFDELHDIGGESSSNPAEDLMGDIYTPQWDGLNELLEKIRTTIGNIIKAVSNFTFWDWLKLAGAALAGFLALKWLLNIFGKGKNPLQTVAEGFSFLEKAVGWALLIWAFTEFTKALTGFVECMKTADWEDIVKSLLMLGGAFVELVGSIILLEWGSLGMDPKAMAGLAALVWVFGEFVKAIIPFIELMWSICDLNDEGKEFEILAGSLSMLALSFVELIAAVAGMEKLTQLIALDWQSLLGLAAVVGVFDLFVKALVPFIETISRIEGDKWDTLIPMIGGLAGAFIALAAGVATVSKFFTAMDWKAIGQLYIVAGAFEIFMFALIPFINAIKDIPFETLAGGTLLIAGAFLALGGAIALMAPALSMLSWSSLFEGLVLMAALAGIIWVLGEFVKNLQGLTSEQMISGLLLLAGALMAITVAIGILAVVFTAVATTGIGIAALALLALILGVVAGVTLAIAELVRAIGEAGAGIKLICEGIAQVVQSVGDIIIGVMQIVSDCISNIIDSITELAVTIAHEIGETIRTIIETIGNIIQGIINSIINAIPLLLMAIVNFCHDIGPAIENSVEAIIRCITRLVNFVVSAVEYICNLVIGAINRFSVPGIGGTRFGFNLQKIEIPRFAPKYETGTNYVPNDGLAYLHQGEAVVPKKYNTPYQPGGMSPEEKAYMSQMLATMRSLDGTMKRGINVNGEFRQRGSDLVSVINKTKSQTGADLLSNVAYAR